MKIFTSAVFFLAFSAVDGKERPNRKGESANYSQKKSLAAGEDERSGGTMGASMPLVDPVGDPVDVMGNGGNLRARAKLAQYDSYGDDIPHIDMGYSFPLGLCEGDCDSNDDCEPGLICYEREESESVPGCSGGVEDGSRTDFCIHLPQIKETNSFPLGYCEGDCDSDDHCRPGLVCHQRNDYEPVPGCSGGSEDGSSTDFCVKQDQVDEFATRPSLSRVSRFYESSDYDNIGQSIALSGDGEVFAYGKLSKSLPSTIVFPSGTRSNLSGSEIGDEFGSAIALSYDGERMAVGIPNSHGGAGSVKVYEYDGSIWKQMGGDLVVPGDCDDEIWRCGRFGHTVSLNSDGDIVAIGRSLSPYSVSIFRFENNAWVQMGEDLTVESWMAASFGWIVSLSSDGLILAVGAPTNEEPDEAGACYIYEYTNNNWQLRGEPIRGLEGRAFLGTSVSLLADGNIVAIGSPFYSPPGAPHGNDNGAVFVFEYSSDSDDWKSLGAEVVGDEAHDHFGKSVSLVEHGNELYFAAGAPNRNFEDGSRGLVRMYVLKVDGGPSYWDLVEEYQLPEKWVREDSCWVGGFGTSVALVSSNNGLRMAVGAPWTTVIDGWNLRIEQVHNGDVTLWQE